MQCFFRSSCAFLFLAISLSFLKRPFIPFQFTNPLIINRYQTIRICVMKLYRCTRSLQVTKLRQPSIVIAIRISGYNIYSPTFFPNDVCILSKSIPGGDIMFKILSLTSTTFSCFSWFFSFSFLSSFYLFLIQSCRMDEKRAVSSIGSIDACRLFPYKLQSFTISCSPIISHLIPTDL